MATRNVLTLWMFVILYYKKSSICKYNTNLSADSQYLSIFLLHGFCLQIGPPVAVGWFYYPQSTCKVSFTQPHSEGSRGNTSSHIHVYQTVLAECDTPKIKLWGHATSKGCWEGISYFQSLSWQVFSASKKANWGTFLVVQWLRLHLPTWGLWVWSQVRELRSHMLHDQKTKTQNRNNTIKNSLKTLKNGPH